MRRVTLSHALSTRPSRIITLAGLATITTLAASIPDALAAGPGAPVPAPPSMAAPRRPTTTTRPTTAPAPTTPNQLQRRRPVTAPQPSIDPHAAQAPADEATSPMDEPTANTPEPMGQFRGFYHPLHEGKDRPYSAEFNLNVSLLPMSTTTPKTNGTKGDAVSNQGVSTELTYLMIFGPIGIGPSLSYSRQMSTKIVLGTNTDPTLPVTKTEKLVTTTNSSYGVLARVYMGRIDKDPLVPFLSLGFSWSDGHYTGDGTATDPSMDTAGSLMSIGTGLYYFLDSNVALSPGVEYQMSSTTFTVNDYREDTTSLGMAMGVTIFI